MAASILKETHITLKDMAEADIRLRDLEVRVLQLMAALQEIADSDTGEPGVADLAYMARKALRQQKKAYPQHG